MVGGGVNCAYLGFIFILFSFSNQEKGEKKLVMESNLKFPEMNCIFLFLLLLFQFFFISNLFFHVIK